MKLRIYQDGFVKTIAQLLTLFRKIIAQLATGGGKTVVFAAICNRYLKKSPGHTVLIMVHRKELLQQTRKTCYNAFNIVCQPITAGMKYIPPADVYVGMVETVSRMLKKGWVKKFGKVGILIIDEAHRLEFMKIHEHFPDCYIIGFSATPVTASKKKPLKNYYDEIVCGIDIPQLIAEGHLCQNITRAPKDTVDRLKLKMKGDEFDEFQMGKEFSKVKYIHNTVSAYEKWANGEKTIIFNVNIAHSLEVCKAFVEKGYNCKHLDSTMNDQEREATLNWFSANDNAILCNVGIATTGFDEPTIINVMVNKAIASMPLWLQICGRGSRPTPQKSMFNIIDMGGNAITHGDWCQSRDWYDLFHNPAKPGKNTVAPIKVCPKCEAVIPAAARECPLCGYKYPAKEIAVEDELHDFIVVTKNIDVDKVMQDHKHKKEYYAVYQIATALAVESKNHIKDMRDDLAEFIILKYYELAKDWMKKVNDHNTANNKKKIFNKWHQARFREHMIDELKKVFPKWESPLFKKPDVDALKIEGLRSLEALQALHYNS